MTDEPRKLTFMDKILVGLAVKFVRGKLEAIMGDNWRGKVGAVGVMITGACTLLYGIACVLGEVTTIPVSGVPCPPEGCSLNACIGMIVAGFGVFTGGLSQYGTRRAISKLQNGG